jgi:endonuclease YncB( thermonuclease family)
VTASLACLIVLLAPGSVARVIDGDTFILYHVGVPPEERVRVLGVNAVELRDTLGPAARTFAIEWLGRGPFALSTCRRDSFGRLLGIVTRGADTLAADLVRARLGTAVP